LDEFSQCYGQDFTAMVNAFTFYLEPELGRYPVFYVRDYRVRRPRC
jgi:hypothetical protein